MPATYLETIGKLQQQGLETLKQVQAVQIGALSSFRSILAGVPVVPTADETSTLPTFADIVELNSTFARKFFEQQNAYVAQLADVFSNAQKDVVAAADTVVKNAAKPVTPPAPTAK